MTKRILVVEDQEDLRGVLRDLFKSSGYTVIEAVDGAAGVASAKTDQPDIVHFSDTDGLPTRQQLGEN